ncbi:hypothetical protein E4T50_07802 [Aureobasidium sp. EXF-12298]|nr:hypothetical protein E4T50_07802 [Aureobasidium sp. EXF-12298]KAI4763831.1 hypothetical protein E4T51_03216 [Aureobasidium sp. EXF-12344]KAI4782597.1 hypothetical protein E4T52_02470 [Aureobasidium sp. EXF-3400]
MQTASFGCDCAEQCYVRNHHELLLTVTVSSTRRGYILVLLICLETYLVFIALQCLAVPVGLLLSPPEKVQRSDGSKVKIVQEKSFAAELRALVAASKRRDILLLLPVSWAAYFQPIFRKLPNLLLRSSRKMSNRLPDQLQWHPLLLPRQHSLGLQTLARQKETQRLVKCSCFGGLLSNPSRTFCIIFFIDEDGQYFRVVKVFPSRFSKEWKGGRVPLAVNTVVLELAVVPTWIALQEHVYH